MTTKNPAPENKKTQTAAKQPAKKRRKRTKGVPAALVAVLLVLCLFFGGLLGFIVANKTNPYAKQLAEANERITSLENYLTMMGFSEENSDPNAWVFDDSDSSDEFNDLSGLGLGDGTEALWEDQSLLEGMMVLEGDPVVVAEFNGGSVMSNEVVDPYNDALATQLFGFSSADDVSGDVLNNVLTTLVADKVLYNKAAELGLTEISDADLEAIKAEAQAYFDDQKDFYGSALDTAGMAEEEAEAAIVEYMKTDIGVSLEGLVEERKADYWIQKLYDYIGKDVTVTDDELKAAYDAKLASQKELFAAYPEEYDYAILDDEIIVHNPEGYRRVKHIMLAFPDAATEEQAGILMESIAMLDPATEMDQITDLQSQLDALYVDLEAQADTVLAELNAGADFEAMIDKYGMDEGMNYEPAKTEGYYVASNSIVWANDFIEGCMALEQIGQISTPVRTVSGVHIIQYIGDVEPGDIDLDQVRDELLAEVRDEKHLLQYEETVAQWITEADAKYYPERLQ